MRTCPSCGHENPLDQKFCGECGTRLEAAAETSEVRKTVTVLFADVVDSTGLGERLDPERVRTLMSRYFELVREALERHGASVEKFIGDAVMAVFGIPYLHEDDALRAVRAALDLAPALSKLEDADASGARIQVRVGLNTGMVVAGDPSSGQNLVTGDAVNVAARLQQSAEPGEILIGEETYNLVRHAVGVDEPRPLELKGKSGTVEARRVRAITDGTEAVARRARSPLVGRKRQLRQLNQALEACTEDRTCELFTVLGTAGVGKSRLVDEFVAGLTDVRVAFGRCLPYGEGITFWPLTEALRSLAGVQEIDHSPEAMAAVTEVLGGEPDRLGPLASLVGLGTGMQSADEISNGARRLFERLGRERPLVVIFDDIHWAEPAFLDLVDHVVEWASQSSILIICTARPDLLDVRPGWGGGKVNAATVLLEPLDQNASEELISNVVGGSLEPALSKQILQSAEGNPLFVEEMVSMLVDDGALVEDDGVWRVAHPDQVRVPASLKMLLAARLDRLGVGERQVISRAAVVGKVFERQAVAALSSEELRGNVSQHLGNLSRRELIRADIASDDLYTFRHILIRDAAYDALPKRERAQLHERFAAWLESDLGEHAAEYEEILGYHLEQAFEAWRDIGEERDDLASKAAELLASAGLRATTMLDYASGISLLDRARTLMPNGPDVPFWTFEIARSRFMMGDLAGGAKETDAALESARRKQDPRAEAWAQLGGTITTATGQDLVATILARLKKLVDVMEGFGDTRGLVYVWDEISSQHNYLCESRECVAAAKRSAAYALQIGDEKAELEARTNVLWRGMWGHLRPEELLRDVEDLRPRATEGSRLNRILHENVAASLALLDRIPEAAEAARAAAEDAAQFGLMTQAVACQIRFIVWSRVDLEVAKEQLDWSDGILERMGETAARASTLAMLADVSQAVGDIARAEEALATCKEIVIEDDFDAVSRSLAAECKILASRGDEQALDLGRRALDLSEPTEYLMMRTRVLTLVAEAHELLGDPEGAVDLYRRARTVAEEKGDLWSIRQMDEALARLGGG
jgi:class 3 adenylate cyclase